MGGIVGKLALLEMEEIGEDHETRLLVTMDSPLRGANIPLGLQHLLDHMNELKIHIVPGVAYTTLGTLVPRLNQLSATFNSPVVKQLLLYHKDESILNNIPNRTFFDKLTGKGKLENCRHLTVTAGSQIGIGQGYDPGQKLFSVQGTSGFILNQVTDTNHGLGILAEIAGNVWLGSNGFTDLDFFAIPDMPGNKRRIYRGLIVARVLHIPRVFDFRDVKVKGTQPLDNAPGGFSPFEGFGDAFIQPRYCFIPSVSSSEVGPFQTLTGPLSNPFQDISDNQMVIDLPFTTMDEMVAVDEPAPNDNIDHAEQFNQDNSSVLLANIVIGANSVGLINENIFNHGDSRQSYDYKNPPANFPQFRTEPIIDADLEIRDQGQLWINREGRIAFTDNLSNLENAVNTTLDVYIRSGYCDGTPSTVTIHQGGKMVLGEWNSTNNVENIGNVFVMEDATVLLGNEGEVFINKESTLVVESGGSIIVEANGLLNAGFGGKIRVKNGGKLIVEEDAMLRISDESSLIIEDGGELIIHTNAKIQLWDPVHTPGRPRIAVYGTLEIEGEFDFSGSHGYFDFYSGHTLKLTGGIFRLNGIEKGKRCMRLNDASLNIGNNRIHLSNGKVEYTGASQIRMSANGEAIIANMKMDGGIGATGLFADGVRVLTISTSDFTGFKYAIVGYDIHPGPSQFDYIIINSSFDNNETSLQISGGGVLNIQASNFSGGPQSIFGMILQNMEGIRISNNSVISGFATDPVNIDSWGAVRVENVSEVVLSNSIITNNDVGIYCPSWAKTNVFMYKQAEISNHSAYGIHIEEGGIDANGVDHGLVLMDCAKLLNNATGIKGRDILLQIDAIENSGTGNPDFIRHNHFEDGPGVNNLFNICYDQRDDIFQINAKGNYWGSDNANPSLVNYALHQRATGACGGASEVLLITSENSANEPSSCPSIPQGPGIPEYPQNAECDLDINQHTSVGEEYFHAYREFASAVDNNFPTYQARLNFALVAGVSDTQRSTGSQTCKHYIDIARVLSDMEYVNVHEGYGQGSSSLNLKNEAFLEKISSQGVNIYPNPASSQLYFTNAPAPCLVIVRSMEGKIIKKFRYLGGMNVIDVSTWSKGLYTFQIISDSNAKRLFKRIIIQ
jgi:hypothetical protein